MCIHTCIYIHIYINIYNIYIYRERDEYLYSRQLGLRVNLDDYVEDALHVYRYIHTFIYINLNELAFLLKPPLDDSLENALHVYIYILYIYIYMYELAFLLQPPFDDSLEDRLHIYITIKAPGRLFRAALSFCGLSCML